MTKNQEMELAAAEMFGVKELKIVNLTPHEITFILEEGEYKVKPSGTVARVTAETKTAGHIFATRFDLKIPVTVTEYGEVEGLPEPTEGVIYIVSSLVAKRVPDRDDVFIPNESIRDDKGRIIGCKSLGHI